MPGRGQGSAGFTDGLLACPGMRGGATGIKGGYERAFSVLSPCNSAMGERVQCAARACSRAAAGGSGLRRFVVALGVGEDPLGDQSGVLPDRRLDLLGDVGIGS